MKHRVSVRLLSLVLAVVMVLGCGVFNALAAGSFGSGQAAEGGKTPIISFSMDELTENGEIINSADNTAYKVLGDTPTLVESQEGHGKALQLDGETNYVNLGIDYQITTGKATIAAWVKVDESPNGLSRIVCRSRTTVSGENDLSLYVRNNGKLEASAPTWTPSNEGAVALGQWQHVAVTNDGTSTVLYVNGEKVKTGAGGEISPEWDIPWLVGAGWNEDATAPFADHMFKGLLDDLQIYDSALAYEEICDLAGVEPEPEPDPGDVELPDAIYEFTMNEVGDGTGELEGQKVIYDTAGNEYPIYGNYRVDDFGIYEQSIEFDGSTTYVNIGKPNIETTYTLEAWTNIDAATQSYSRLNKIFGRDKTTVGHDSLYLCVRGNGNVEYSVRGNEGTSGGTWITAGEGTYKFNTWNHIAVTYDGSNYKLYYNGELVNNTPGTAVDQQTNPMDLLIGAGYNAEGTGIFTGHAFKGRMDDVRIYNVALTDAQIKKSTEGIKDKLPPEVTAVSPDSSMIGVSGVVTLTYSDTIELGEAKPTIAHEDGTAVACTVSLKDESEQIAGLDSLVITPETELVPGETYTYTLPAGVVKSGVGTNSLAGSYTYTVKQKLEGNAAASGMEYWVNDFYQDTTPNTSYIKEEDGKVVIGNKLVERTFDLEQNFLTVDYKNLYTGIQALDKNNLQADIRMALTDDFYDEDDSNDVLFDVGGTDNEVPTFQYVSHSVEDSTEEIFHWEWREDISPNFMENASWPAAGKALVVNYKAPENAGIYAGVTVQVRYEIYDGIPVICKRVTVANTGEYDVVVHHLTSEVLPMPTSLEDAIYMEGSMNMGDNHDRNNGRYLYTKWIKEGDTGLLMSRYTNGSAADAPEYGPAYRIKQGEKFEAYRVYELFHSSSYFEWQMMEVRAMYQVLFPQTLDAPLIYHIISSNPDEVKRGIDEAATAGFNMVLLSFGSGVNTENISEDNIAKYKELCEYAHSKDIMLGSYIMQVARGDGAPDDIYSGGWGRMRCMNTKTAQTTQENNLAFIEATGLDCMEVDGIYPGSICTGNCTNHGHEGREDSIVKQWEYGVRDYYSDLRAYNVYINSPDWSYMTGANMAVMGYVEEGFNVHRQRQLIYHREMGYYGTFEKMPAMGWTLVPITPYKGGDESAYWPANERIQEYDYLIGVNMMYGVVGSYRGKYGLYQEGPSQNVMETWGDFYNKYRGILGEDVVHIAPPLAESDTSYTTTAIDGIVHVSTVTEQKALAAFFNQTKETVTQKVKIPLYYTGLTDCDVAPAPVEGSHYRESYVWSDMLHMPEVPEIPEVDAVPTDKQVYVCIGDMNGQYYTVDSNGDIEVELTMEPNTYTWLTVYDPENIPEDVKQPVSIPAPANFMTTEQSSNSISLTWDAVQMNGRDVKEYHVYRDGEYVGKTFTTTYIDSTVQNEQDYVYEVAAVHNTVAGEKTKLNASTRPDTEGPEVVSAKATSATEITVTFSERLDQATAETVSNYTVEGASVTAAKLDGSKVVLTLDKAMTAFETVKVTARNVKDVTGNTMTAEAQLEVVFGYLRKFSFEDDNAQVAVDSVENESFGVGGLFFRRDPNGVSGKAIDMDGTSNYINIGFPVNALSEYAITGWFKADDLTGHQTLVGQQRPSYDLDKSKYNLALVEDVLTFTVNNGPNQSGSEIVLELTSGATKVNPNQWNQFGIVRDGDKFTLYLNGEAVDTETKEGIDQSKNTQSMWLGAYIDPAGGVPMDCFGGLMDEVQIYNAVRTAEQIKEEYDSVEQGCAHDLTHVAAQAATCVAEGNKEYWHCKDCGKNFADEAATKELADVTTPVDKNNHVGGTVIRDKKPATWLENGYTGDTYCKSCDTLLEKGEVIPRKGSGIGWIPSVPDEKPSWELPFTDVNKGDWFYESVYYAWDEGLINGVTAERYQPDGSLTVAQGIKLASALHEKLNRGYVTLENGTANWYDTYVDYAVNNDIIEAKYQSYTKAQMDAAITRNEFVHIFHGAMDDYKAINDVSDNAIPDVKLTDAYAAEIYDFYRAGILTGSDGAGTFNGTSTIKRSEVAAILIRMYDETLRQRIELP